MDSACREFWAAISRLVFPKSGLGIAPCFWHPEREMHFVNKMEKLNTKNEKSLGVFMTFSHTQKLADKFFYSFYFIKFKLANKGSKYPANIKLNLKPLRSK